MAACLCLVTICLLAFCVNAKSKYVALNLHAKWRSTPLQLEARYALPNQNNEYPQRRRVGRTAMLCLEEGLTGQFLSSDCCVLWRKRY